MLGQRASLARLLASTWHRPISGCDVIGARPLASTWRRPISGCRADDVIGARPITARPLGTWCRRSRRLPGASAEAVAATPTTASRRLDMAPQHRLLHGPPSTTLDEFSDEPLYPAIPTFKDRDEREEANLVEMIKDVATVEEKQYFINKPKYFGWYSTILDVNSLGYGSHDLVQFVTRTHTVEGLPDAYGALDAEADAHAQRLESAVKEFIFSARALTASARDVGDDAVEWHEKRGQATFEQTRKREAEEAFVTGLHRLLASALRPAHLAHAQLDARPRLEAFWFKGGFPPDKRMVTKKKGWQKFVNERPVAANTSKRYPGEPVRQITDEEVYKPYDRVMQIKGRSLLQLRGRGARLRPFLAHDAPLCAGADVADWPYEPASVPGITHRTQHGVNTPGHWTGSANDAGFLSFVGKTQNSANALDTAATGRSERYSQDHKHTLSKAILTSFGSLLSQATHLGFSPLNDVTSPLATQTIVTDGRDWRFTAYQLNICALQCNESSSLPRQNICWQLPEQRLYEDVDDLGVVGFDRDVLKTLIKFYLLPPAEEPTAAAKALATPYLHKARYLHNVKDDYNRQDAHDKYMYMCSNRPRRFEKPETTHYERIYEMTHKDLPRIHIQGLREKPWRQMAKLNYLGKEHWHPEFRQLDDFNANPIPRGFRKSKFAKDRYYKKVVPWKVSEDEDY